MFQQFFESLDGAFAPNTIRAYRSDLQHYADWCQNNQYDLFSVDAVQFTGYVLAMGETLKTATIRRRVASLSSMFKLMKQPDPTNEPEVVLALKRLHRKLGRHQKQATPLTKDILKKLIAVCSDDLRGLRNKLLLQLGYETMRRRSEIVGFRFEDIEHLPNGRAALLLRHSKTDQYGDGKLIPISDELFQLIKQWKRESGLSEGKIIRGFMRDGKTMHKELSSASVNNILKELQRNAKLKVNELSGHSFRVGAAVDLLDQGLSIEKIMLKGGWKSETTAMRYLRNWQGWETF